MRYEVITLFYIQGDNSTGSKERGFQPRFPLKRNRKINTLVAMAQ